MKKARDIMTDAAEVIGEKDTIVDAARKLKQYDIGALPICGADKSLKGMLTDRDIVVKVLAAGRDPAGVKASELEQGQPVTIDADDSVDEAMQTMMRHKIRRLPVIDGKALVGMISQADIARNVDETKSGEFLRTISSAP